MLRKWTELRGREKLILVATCKYLYICILVPLRRLRRMALMGQHWGQRRLTKRCASGPKSRRKPDRTSLGFKWERTKEPRKQAWPWANHEQSSIRSRDHTGHWEAQRVDGKKKARSRGCLLLLLHYAKHDVLITLYFLLTDFVDNLRDALKAWPFVIISFVCHQMRGNKKGSIAFSWSANGSYPGPSSQDLLHGVTYYM